MTKIFYAPDAWKLLEGIFCVYKPAKMTMRAMRERILINVCRDLNAMEVRPPENFVKIEEDPTSDTGLTITNTPSLADDPLVVGPRYQLQDFTLSWPSLHGPYTSGLCVVGINCGRITHRLTHAKYLKSYYLSGKFGVATDDFHASGKLLEKSTYGHIKQFKLDHVLSALQAAHQRHMFQYMGVNIQSQDAYDMASKGLVRPANESVPLLYGIKCIDMQMPEFTLEIQCINESEAYLMELVHEIGLTLKSNAVCTKLRQVRYGPFDLEHALLRKHWTVEHIISNITACRKVLDPARLFPAEANLMVEYGPKMDQRPGN